MVIKGNVHSEEDLTIDGEVVSRISGDGLIVSTPIGSTAHNLSAGGPILSQELSAFVITPVCPHALAHRPLVDSADKAYTIALAPGARGAVLIVDGQETLPLAPEDRAAVRQCAVPNSSHIQLPASDRLSRRL